MTNSIEETTMTTVTTTAGETTVEEVTTTTTTSVEVATEAAPVSPKGETAHDTKKRESPDAQPAGQPEAKKITIESSKEGEAIKEEEKFVLEEKPSEEADKSAEKEQSEDTTENAVDKDEKEEAPSDEKDENDKPLEAKKLDEAVEESKPVAVEQ
jgi:hypothetical protein